MERNSFCRYLIAFFCFLFPFSAPAAVSQLVIDPTAPKGRAHAIDIQEERGAATLVLPSVGDIPGLYRLSLPLRLLDDPSFHSGVLVMQVDFGGASNTWLSLPISPAQWNAAPDKWTTLTRSIIFTERSPTNSLHISWFYIQNRPPLKKKTAPAAAKPPANKPSAPAPPPAPEKAVDPNTAVPLTEIDYPALLVGEPTFEPVNTSLIVEKVWPDFVHVYPGGTNNVTVTLHNFSAQPINASIRLEMKSGLDESALVGDQSVAVPAASMASVKFPWISNGREFGQAVVATVSQNGKPVHSATEYFSVSTPIWKTAIQGNGFVSWFGREAGFPQHVTDNRRAYVNVEEAFSWQPSSWTDLNPTNADWWSGQGSGHNSMSGLHDWIDRSHAEGIKMITYSWPTISGPAGFDWGQRFPDTLCRDDSGVGGGVNADALHWQAVTHERKELWPYQEGSWIRNMVNLGLLRTIDQHARQIIQSSRSFGWDGMRFDMPPGWSEIGTNDVMRELEMLNATDAMRQLMPEAMNTTSNVWTGQQISDRNVRYFRYLFQKELGLHFALSYNVGSLEPIPDKSIPWFAELSKGGGQLMNEAIRNANTISNYMVIAQWHTVPIQGAGGYTCLFRAERCPAPLASIYSAIFTFALGSHPYLDYGWLGPLPGEYTKFMTRYGEYCWDLALKPITPADAHVTVESRTPLLWESFLRTRQTGDTRQTIIHLITQPEFDPAKSLQQSQVVWPTDVVVKKQAKSEPTVWLLTAEPEITATRLPVSHSGNTYSVTVPSMHYWTMLVWSEKP